MATRRARLVSLAICFAVSLFAVIGLAATYAFAYCTRPGVIYTIEGAR